MTKKHLVFLGPPGAGKGTHAAYLHQQHGHVHLSTGDMLRAAKREGSELGMLAASFMDQGKLVPDDLVIELICDRFCHLEDGGSWILDGFPRTLPQAEALDERLAKDGNPLDCVFCFDVEEEELVRRLSSRQICRNCGTVYNTRTKPAKRPGVCDNCGKPELYVRPDDQPDAVRHRFEVYQEQTAPLIHYYTELGLLVHVDASRDIESIRADLQRNLED